MAKSESGHSTPDPDALLLPDDEELILETEEESTERQEQEKITQRGKDILAFLDYLQEAKNKELKREEAEDVPDKKIQGKLERLLDRIKESKNALDADKDKDAELALKVVNGEIKDRTAALKKKDVVKWGAIDEKIFDYMYKTVRKTNKELSGGVVLMEEDELVVFKKYLSTAKKKPTDISEGEIEYLEKQFKILEDNFSALHVEAAPSASETSKGTETMVSPEAGGESAETIPEENIVNPKTGKTPAEVAAQRKQKQEELLQSIKDSAEAEFQRDIAQGKYKAKEQFEKNTDTELAERLWIEKYNQAFSNLSEEKKNQLFDFGGEKYGVINETGVADLLAAGYSFDDIKSIKFAGRWSHKVKSKIVPGAVDEEDFREKVAEIVKQKKEEMMGERWEQNHRLAVNKKIAEAKENLRVEALGKMKDAWEEANEIDKALKSKRYEYATIDGEILKGEKALQDKKDKLSSRVSNIASQFAKENLMEKSAQEAGYKIGSKKDLAKQREFRKNLTEHVRDVLTANGLIEKHPEPAAASKREEVGDLDLTLDEEIDLNTSQKKDDEFLLAPFRDDSEQATAETAEDDWDDFFASPEIEPAALRAQESPIDRESRIDKEAKRLLDNNIENVIERVVRREDFNVEKSLAEDEFGNKIERIDLINAGDVQLTPHGFYCALRVLGIDGFEPGGTFYRLSEPEERALKNINVLPGIKILGRNITQDKVKLERGNGIAELVFPNGKDVVTWKEFMKLIEDADSQIKDELRKQADINT